MSQLNDERQDSPDASSTPDELPSVAMTARFLALCNAYGAQRLAIAIVSAGRAAGVTGLPPHDDWPEWNASQMRAAVEYLEYKRGIPVTLTTITIPARK